MLVKRLLEKGERWKFGPVLEQKGDEMAKIKLNK